VTEPETRIVPTRPANRRKIFVFIQLMVVLGLLTSLMLGCSTTSEVTSIVAPPRLDGLPLVTQTTGLEAVSDMQGLHGKEIGLIGGYVAQYQADGRSITVWLGQAESQAAAEELLDRMTEKIGDGNAYFRNLEEILVDGRIVYSTIGGGEDHYYYRSADKVIWLSISSAEPLEILRSAIGTIE
jgi:hypothetical protein